MKHHILVKWKKEYKDKINIEEIKSIFDKTLTINGVKNVEYIPNVIDRPNRYDLLIRIEMEIDTLVVYDSSVYHKMWKEKYSDLIDSKAIFDSEF